MKPQRKKSLKSNLRRFILPLSLVLILGAIPTFAAEPGMVPLTRDTMASLVRRTIEAKLIPFTMEEDSGLSITLTEIRNFNMDWEKGEFTADVAFDAQYTNKIVPIPIKQSGEAAVVGCGLLSVQDQKFGVKLLRIAKLNFSGLLQLASDPICNLLNRKLAGKTIWQGDPPGESITMNGTNWTEIIEIAVASKLPINATNGKSTVSINRLNFIEETTQPGAFRVSLEAAGNYKGLISLPFDGSAVVNATVLVAPDELKGVVRIDDIESVELNNLPSFVSGMVRRSVGSKLKGEEFPFSWQ